MRRMLLAGTNWLVAALVVLDSSIPRQDVSLAEVIPSVPPPGCSQLPGRDEFSHPGIGSSAGENRGTLPLTGRLRRPGRNRAIIAYVWSASRVG